MLLVFSSNFNLIYILTIFFVFLFKKIIKERTDMNLKIKINTLSKMHIIIHFRKKYFKFKRKNNYNRIFEVITSFMLLNLFILLNIFYIIFGYLKCFLLLLLLLYLITGSLNKIFLRYLFLNDNTTLIHTLTLLYTTRLFYLLVWIDYLLHSIRELLNVYYIIIIFALIVDLLVCL